MKIRLSFVLRLGSADTLAPLEKAIVSKSGERAMHRDGGYYVFVTPMKAAERISVEAPGYSKTEFVTSGESSAVMYLDKYGLSHDTALMSAKKNDKGAEKISVVCPAGELPAMLEGCMLRYGESSSDIVSWDRTSGVMTITPAKENISQGQTLTVTPPCEKPSEEMKCHF